MARVRLVDVAREAGVSVSTASEALTGKGRVQAGTRAHVRAVADRLGYVPDPVARSLRTRRLPIVGLVAGSLQRPAERLLFRGYWENLLGSAALAAADRGYALVVLPGIRPELAASIPMSAIIVFDERPGDPEIGIATAIGVPVAAEGRDPRPGVAVTIDMPWGEAVADALDALAAAGARTPGLLTLDEPTDYYARCLAGARAWAERTGAPLQVAALDPLTGSPAAAIAALLDHGCDAIVTLVDGVAEVEAAAADRGLRVGRELRLVAASEDEDGSLARAGIATIAFGVGGAVEQVVGAVLSVVEGRAMPPVRIVGAHRLNLRASAGTAPRRTG